jgi:rod shape-determining protein MreB
LRGLDILLKSSLKIPIYIAEDPLTAVARGTGVILDDFENFQEVLVNTDDTSTPR